MAGSEARKAATTPPIIIMRLKRYAKGDIRMTMVFRPPLLRTTFSNCKKINMDTVEASAAARHNHDSTRVGNLVSQEMRWRAPKEAPKMHVTGQRNFERYKLGSQGATTVCFARREETLAFRSTALSIRCIGSFSSSWQSSCWASCSARSSASLPSQILKA